MSRPTRRAVLGVAAAAPLVALAGRFAGTARRNAAALRPGGEGTSSGRCATCGDSGHSMLACPDSPTVV